MSDHWNRVEGSRLTLFTYTNADEVELFINGTSVGVKQNDRANSKVRNRMEWTDVPYEAGNIVAVARNNGKEVARHRVETTGDAVALTVEGDNANWKADGTDLLHVRVCAVDRKGRRVQGARQRVEFSVEGPAEIVGVINGDIASDELSVGNSRSLYNGTVTVILRASQEAGSVKLTATADGLKRATRQFTLQSVPAAN